MGELITRVGQQKVKGPFSFHVVFQAQAIDKTQQPASHAEHARGKGGKKKRVYKISLSVN